MFTLDADLPLAEQGVWTEYSSSKFLIAHISSMRFQRALARHQQPYRKKIEQGSLDPQIQQSVLCRAISEAILLDWSDVKSSSGEVAPYSSDAAYTALMKNPEFREFVSEFAMNLNNYRESEVEQLGKP